jgi:translocation-and-assembly-module (TAM) inner membrane subunit TamB-like protein
MMEEEPGAAGQAGAADAPVSPTAPGPAPSGRRRAVRSTLTILRRTLAIAAILLAVAFVTTVSVDLGPALRRQAERGGAGYLHRDFGIGRLSIRLLTGTFVVEDLRIGGLNPGDRPFLTAKSIDVGVSFSALLHREFLVDSVVMHDWNMLVEKWPGDRHSFPKFTRDSSASKGPKRLTTTVSYVLADRGQFTYEDHETPWTVVARNLAVTVAKSRGYGGTAKFSGATIAIQQYKSMTADMQGWFTIDGPNLHFSRLDLLSDGAKTGVTGDVDLTHFPEMTWHVDSVVNFPRMKDIFFAREPWRVAGEGHFLGVFHLFKGGRDLRGTFDSPEAHVNDLRFPDLRGSLRWTPTRFEVTGARSRFYGGGVRFEYAIAPLGAGKHPSATFDTNYDAVDLSTLGNALAWSGIRTAGHLSGHTALEWPLGRFVDRHGKGDLFVTAPAGTSVLPRVIPPGLASLEADRPRPWGPFNNDPRILGEVPIGGELHFQLDPEWITLSPSAVSTPRTFVSFEGRTAYGDRSTIPFHVTSADWQESDQVLAGIMTAFGSETTAVSVGGTGEFDGVMRLAFKHPRIEGRFRGERMRAWDVTWGRATGELVIEDSYVSITKAQVGNPDGSAVIETDGRFALGYPRRDGGEEINARIRATRWPLADLRHAFLLDDWPLQGRMSGEFHLYGRYETPEGFGRLQIDEGSAWRELFETGSSALRFEGAGVRLDGIEATKAGGRMSGAAYVGWDGTYSFNFSGRRVPVESLNALNYPTAQPSGLLDFTASGSGLFDSPRYEARLSVADLYLKDEGVGAVTARVGVRNNALNLELEAASPRLALTGSGRIALTPEADAELTLRVTDTSLDPYVRAFQPDLSPFTTAVASGSMRIAGELADPRHLQVDGKIDALTMNLFDYAVKNDGPIRVGYDQQTIRLAELRLVGEDTRLDVGGTINLDTNQIGVHATGEANLGILQGFMRDIRSTGQADLKAEVAGPLDKPVFSGQASIAGGRIRHFSLPHSLDAINGTVAFDATGLRVDGLTARLGGGLVRFGGRIAMDGYRPGEFNLTATGEGMRLRYPEGFRSLVDADLSLRGPFEAPVLGGTVTVRSSVWARRFETSINLLEFVGHATPVGTPAAPTSFPLRFDVHLLAPSSLRIDNNLARITSSADLALRGTYDRPLLFGRAEIEHGEVTFEGKRYVVQHGTIDFSNPNQIEPFFDVEAQTRVRVPGQNYIVTLNAAGTFARLQWGLNSDPPLPTVDVLSMLLSDTAPTDPELAALERPDAAKQQLLQARAAQLLVSPLSSEVGRVVEQTFGVDTFQITPSLTDAAAQSSRLVPGARLTIGKRISSRVYLTFSQSLSASSTTRDQVILLEFDESDRLSWVLSQNEDRTYALDVRVRHAF